MLEGRFSWESVCRKAESAGHITYVSAAGALDIVIPPFLSSTFKKLLFVPSAKTIFHGHFLCSGGEGASGAVSKDVLITRWVLAGYDGGRAGAL